jgi:hypothetical protein
MKSSGKECLVQPSQQQLYWLVVSSPSTVPRSWRWLLWTPTLDSLIGYVDVCNDLSFIHWMCIHRFGTPVQQRSSLWSPYKACWHGGAFNDYPLSAMPCSNATKIVLNYRKTWVQVVIWVVMPCNIGNQRYRGPPCLHLQGKQNGHRDWLHHAWLSVDPCGQGIEPCVGSWPHLACIGEAAGLWSECKYRAGSTRGGWIPSRPTGSERGWCPFQESQEGVESQPSH